LLLPKQSIMVARTALKRQHSMQKKTSDWREQLKMSSLLPQQLLTRLGLPIELLDGLETAHRLFPLRIPEAFIQRMQYANPQDPLLLQVLPVFAETSIATGFSYDPVGDLHSYAAPGILHKYQARALLIVTGACAVNCRYCFRRHFPYSEQQIKPALWQQSLDYLSNDDSIHEVILSGGDPLILSTKRLSTLTRDLQNIPHIRRLRIHTRLPVVLPDRVTDELCQWLQQLPWPVCIVLHCNHAQEIDIDFQNACNKLKQAGATLLNQAVLLKCINDSTEAQRDLSEKLYSSGVIPYYLHQLDPVIGSQHFQVSHESALSLYRKLRSVLPGYLLPKLVQELPGKDSKLPL